MTYLKPKDIHSSWGSEADISMDSAAVRTPGLTKRSEGMPTSDMV